VASRGRIAGVKRSQAAAPFPRARACENCTIASRYAQPPCQSYTRGDDHGPCRPVRPLYRRPPTPGLT
jgi:hypothetical protein